MGKLLLAGSLFAITLAATVTLQSDGSAHDPLARSVESQTLWMCRDCSQSFRFTADEVSKLQRGSADRFAALRCPGCRAFEAYLAKECSRCNTVFLGPEVPGVDGKCPTCHGVHATPDPSLRELKENPEKPPVKVF